MGMRKVFDEKSNFSFTYRKSRIKISGQVAWRMVLANVLFLIKIKLFFCQMKEKNEDFRLGRSGRFLENHV